jgi:hypothetical protein
MTGTPPKRGTPRRILVKSTPHYERWRLHEGGSVTIPRPAMSAAALWTLLSYLPPEVRLQPWVKHLVEGELSRVRQAPVVSPQAVSLAQ